VGWFLTTILLPVVAPNVMLAIWRAWVHLPGVDPGRLKPLVPLKDGQLCWAAIGFCASGLYELFEPGRVFDPQLRELFLTALVVLLAASSVVAGGGAVFPAPDKPAGVKWHTHYKALKGSLVLTAASAIAYTLVHFPPGAAK